jgi:hypothetical protein
MPKYDVKCSHPNIPKGELLNFPTVGVTLENGKTRVLELSTEQSKALRSAFGVEVKRHEKRKRKPAEKPKVTTTATAPVRTDVTAPATQPAVTEGGET